MELWPPPGGFADRMLQRTEVYHLSDFAGEIDHFGMEHLEFIMVAAACNAPHRSRAADEMFVVMGMAYEVVRFFLGDEWSNNSLYGPPEVRAKYQDSRGYLKSDAGDDDPESRFRHQQRVTCLAECLYNLRDVPGIEYRLSQMHNDDFEAALGEMECAKLVASPQSQFKFIIPTGVMGLDYDAEFVVPGGTVACCEIKTRKESTELRTQTVWSTLDRARKQLPKNKPGIVFLKIPEAWVTKPFASDICDYAIAKVLRQSNRLVAIVIVWEEWRTIGGSRLVVTMLKPSFNERSSLLSDEIRLALKGAGTIRSPNWVRFHSLVLNRLPIIANAFEQWKPPSEAAIPDQRYEKPEIPEQPR